MNNDRVVVITLKDPVTGRENKVWMHFDAWKELKDWENSLIKKPRPLTQGLGLMFHPDRSHETPEFKQAVINRVRNFKFDNNMKNPRVLEHYKQSENESMGITAIKLPTYRLGENGMEDGSGHTIPLCKGTKEIPADQRKEGVFTESLIQASIDYLQNVNVGTLQNIDTTEAVQHLKAALACLERRNKRRKENGTIYTKK